MKWIRSTSCSISSSFLHLSLETVIQIQWHKSSFAFIVVARKTWNIWDILININYKKKQRTLFRLGYSSSLYFYVIRSLRFLSLLFVRTPSGHFSCCPLFFLWNIRRNTCSFKDSTRLERTVNLKLGRGERNLYLHRARVRASGTIN